MSSENKLLAKRWFEKVWNRRQTESIKEMLAEDAVAHGLSEADSPLRGTEGFAGFHKAFLNAFPDLKVTTEDFIAEDHKVAIRWRVSGTLQGDGLGIQPNQKR
jgi:steroid delta-isomerase-like uncharacterized protein